jgi:hypothetical protein
MLDTRTEHHFLRLISQKNSTSDLIPDNPEGILDDDVSRRTAAGYVSDLTPK